MKRTNLVLDEKLLAEMMSFFKVKTYSEAVNKAMAEIARQQSVLGLWEFVGSGIWQGDLAEMRGDSPRRRKKKTA